jgi:hypothetical protein
MNSCMIGRVRSFRCDSRWQAMLRGLDQLSTDELGRLQRACTEPSRFQLMADGGNYEPISGNWCALAVAVDVPGTLNSHGLNPKSRVEGKAALLEVGRSVHGTFETNPLSGVRGDAFTSERILDLQLAVRFLLDIRILVPNMHSLTWNESDCDSLIEVVADSAAAISLWRFG